MPVPFRARGATHVVLTERDRQNFQNVEKFLLTNCEDDGIINFAWAYQKEAFGLISQLKTGKKVVGLKQTRKAAAAGRARAVFLAHDADPAILAPVAALCREEEIPVDTACSMKELGEACGISVGASACALLRD